MFRSRGAPLHPELMARRGGGGKEEGEEDEEEEEEEDDEEEEEGRSCSFVQNLETLTWRVGKEWLYLRTHCR